MPVKGTCGICDRDDMVIVGHDVCAACWPIGKKFKWDIKKAREHRKEHPVKTRGGGET